MPWSANSMHVCALALSEAVLTKDRRDRFSLFPTIQNSGSVQLQFLSYEKLKWFIICGTTWKHFHIWIISHFYAFSQSIHSFGKFWEWRWNDRAKHAVISTYSHCGFTHLISCFSLFYCFLTFLLCFTFSLTCRPFWEKERLVISVLRLLRNAVSDEMWAVIASLKESSHNILWQSQAAMSLWIYLPSLRLQLLFNGQNSGQLSFALAENLICFIS